MSGDAPQHRVAVARGRLTGIASAVEAHVRHAEAAGVAAAKHAGLVVPAAPVASIEGGELAVETTHGGLEARFTVQGWSRDVLEAPALLGLAATLTSLLESARRGGSVPAGEGRLEGLHIVQHVIL